MYRPVIREDKCTNCRACERICPKGVFDPDEADVSVGNPIRCTGCESCTAVCPMNAITVEET
jgi:NAD-dependent dihydropyrimidine dehydrogenase PreA subunit